MAKSNILWQSKALPRKYPSYKKDSLYVCGSEVAKLWEIHSAWTIWFTAYRRPGRDRVRMRVCVDPWIITSSVTTHGPQIELADGSLVFIDNSVYRLAKRLGLLGRWVYVGCEYKETRT